MLELSIYTLQFCNKSHYYVYNSRSNFFSEISKELYDAFKSQNWDSLPDFVIEELKSKELICESNSKFDFYYSQLISFNARNNDRTTLNLVLAPTTACNFACPYCFESKKNPKTIDEETIDALAEFVKSHQDANKVHIHWYGGEPLLAFDKMEAIYQKLSAEGMPEISSQAITTNGYCFTDEVIDFFKEKGCANIQITIDGLHERHNATRCLKNSPDGTFETIVANIDKIITQLPETRLNIRVNINKNNYTDFIDVANFFKAKYPGNKMLSVYPGLIREEDENRRTLCSSSFGTSEKLELNELLRTHGFDISDFPNKSMRGCMMQNTMSYLIGPEGEIYKCWNDIGNLDAVLGNIKSKDFSNISRYLKYSIQAAPFNDECRQCHAFPICDGGCSYYRYRNMFENCHFDLCSPYKDKNKLVNALLSGKLPQQS